MLEDRGVKIISIVSNSLEFSFKFFELKNPQNLQLDLKKAEDLDKLKKILPKVNILLESFRPGVMERLGLSPEEIHAINPDLIFVRLSAYGQHTSIAKQANHDINFLALNGILNKIKPYSDQLNRDKDQESSSGGQLQLQYEDANKPVIPFNVIGDYVGGSLGSFTLIL